MRNNILLGVIAVGIVFSVMGDIFGLKEQRMTEMRIMRLEKRLDSLTADVKKLYLTRMAAQPPQEDLNKVYDIPVGSSAVKGGKNAAAMVVMFADFECPFCARYYGPVKELLAAYPDKVKLMIKNFPLNFHKNAIPAAKAALAAGLQGKYFEMAGLLMDNKGDVSEEKLQEYIKISGINAEKFFKDLKEKDADFKKQIDDDMVLAAKSDVRGTPAFYLNGKKVRARNLADWVSDIEALTPSKK